MDTQQLLINNQSLKNELFNIDSISQTLFLKFVSNNELKNIQWIEENLHLVNNIVELKIVFLKYSNIDAKSLESISILLKNLINLKRFTLELEQQSYIDEEGFTSVAKTIQNFHNLDKFELQMSQFDQKGLKDIGESLLMLKNLRMLSISNDILDGIDESQFLIICQAIKGQKYLEKLSLQLPLQKICATALDILSDYIQYLSNMQELDLIFKNNEYPLMGFQNFSKALKSFQDLKVLRIQIEQSIKYEKDVIDQFICSLSQLNKLEQLIIPGFFDYLDNCSKVDLLKILVKNNNLKTIDLDISQLNKGNEEYQELFVQLLHVSCNIQKLSLLFNNDCSLDQPIATLIGSKFQRMQNIQELILDFDCQFSLYGFQDLLESISHQQNLKILKLRFQNGSSSLSSRNLSQIFTNLNYLHKLEILDLSFGVFFEQIGQLYINPFLNLKKLTVLNIKIRQMKKVSLLELLLTEFQYLIALKELTLDIHVIENITAKSFLNASNSFNYLTQLMKLKLYIKGSTIQEEEALIAMFQQFKNFKQLTSLDLFLNYSFTTHSLSILGIALSNLLNLEQLQMFFNFNISLEQFIFFGKYVSLMTSLTDLNLQFNRYLTDGQFNEQEFIDIFSPLQNLRVLKIQYKSNSMTQMNLHTIFMKSIQHLKQLQKLDISIGRLDKVTDKSAESIKNCLKSLQQLKVLTINSYLSNKRLTNVGFQDICKGLMSLEELRELNGHIYCNQQNTCILLEICKKLKNIRNIDLEFDNYEHNYISKEVVPIPISQSSHTFSHLKSLKLCINIDNNQLSLLNTLQAMKCLQELKSFVFQINEKYEINNEEIKTLGQTLENLPQLTQFDFYLSSDCNLVSECFKYFCNGISKLHNLEQLVLEIGVHVKFDIPIASKIFIALRDLNNLLSLNLNLSGPNCIEDSELLIGIRKEKQIPLKLQAFFFAYEQNEILPNLVAISISNILGNAEQLIELNLLFNDNQVNDEKAIILSNGISKLINLRVLYFYSRNNYIGDAGAQTLFKSIQNLKNLQKLDFKIDDQKVISIISFFNDILLTSHLNEVSHFLPICGEIDEISMYNFGVYLEQKRISRITLTLLNNGEDLTSQILVDEEYLKLNYEISFELQNQNYLSLLLGALGQLPEDTEIQVIFYGELQEIFTEIKTIKDSFNNLYTKNLDLHLKMPRVGTYFVELLKGLQKMKNLIKLNLKITSDIELSLNVAQNIINEISKLQNLLELKFQLQEQNEVKIQDMNNIIKQLSNKMQNLRIFNSSQLHMDNQMQFKRLYNKVCKSNIRLVKIFQEEQ